MMLVMESRAPAIQPSLTSYSQINQPTKIEATPVKNESPDVYDNLRCSYLRKFSNLDSSGGTMDGTGTTISRFSLFNSPLEVSTNYTTATVQSHSTTGTVQSHSTTATVQSSLSNVAAIVAPIVIILLLIPAIAIVAVTILISFRNKKLLQGKYDAKKIVFDNTNIIGTEDQVKVESKNNKMRSSQYEDVDTRGQKLASDIIPKSVSSPQYEDMDSFLPPIGSDSAKPPEKQLASENIPKSVSGPQYEDMDSFLPPIESYSAKTLPDEKDYNRLSFDYGQSGRRYTYDPSDSNYSHLEPFPAYAEMRPRIDTDPHVYAELHMTQKKSELSKAIDAIMEESVPPVQAS